MTSAATSLYWRLREVFEVGGGYYLAIGGGTTRYEEYKAFSTRYRVAALLGWMTALRRELVLCDAQPDSSVGSMRDAIDGVEKSLAEGGSCRGGGARLLCELWELSLQEGQADGVGRKIDATLKRTLHASGRSGAPDLKPQEQDSLVNEIASMMSTITGQRVPPETLDGSRDAVVDILSIREAWLYGDWQSAIGDMMLEQPVGAARRFDVRSYRWFTETSLDGSDADKAWID